MATEADGAEVVRLACVMFVSMGMDDPDDAWRTMSAEHFARRVGRDGAPSLRRRSWDPPPRTG